MSANNCIYQNLAINSTKITNQMIKLIIMQSQKNSKAIKNIIENKPSWVSQIPLIV